MCDSLTFSACLRYLLHTALACIRDDYLLVIWDGNLSIQHLLLRLHLISQAHELMTKVMASPVLLLLLSL